MLFQRKSARLSGGGDSKDKPGAAVNKNPQSKPASQLRGPVGKMNPDKDPLQFLSNEKIDEHFDKIKYSYMRPENLGASQGWLIDYLSNVEAGDIKETLGTRLNEIDKLPIIQRLLAYDQLMTKLRDEDKPQVEEERQKFLSANLEKFSIANNEKQLSKFISSFRKITDTGIAAAENTLLGVFTALSNLENTGNPNNKMTAVSQVLREIDLFKTENENDELRLAWISYLQAKLSNQEVSNTIQMEIIIDAISRYPHIEDPVEKLLFIDDIKLKVETYAQELGGSNALLDNIHNRLDETKTDILAKLNPQQKTAYQSRKIV